MNKINITKRHDIWLVYIPPAVKTYSFFEYDKARRFVIKFLELYKDYDGRIRF